MKKKNQTESLFENEWHEIVCYVIFIAAFYETEYNAYLKKNMNMVELDPAFHMSTDCLWNTNIVQKIIEKYKKYSYSLDKKYYLTDLLNDDSALFELWEARYGFLRIVIMDDDTVEHVFSIQKIDGGNYRLFETNVRSHIDLRHSFFEIESYGRPYSWDNSTSNKTECEKFIRDNIQSYNHKNFLVILYMDLVF